MSGVRRPAARGGDVLAEILLHKLEEVERARAEVPPAVLAERAAAAAPARGFRSALVTAPPPRVVAEIKRRSPSRGEIRADFDPVACARAYAAGGAAALSVLTDERYFGGHLSFLARAREAVPLPLLRKDFVVDPYQVDEARAAGADAVLLIAAAVPPHTLAELHKRARERGLDALVEVHDEEDLAAALACGADLVGINNRDLKSFRVDLATTERLAAELPEGVVVVSESGIFRPEDVARLAEAGADAFLVGEALMRERDPARALEELRRIS